jgi:hypothetical protein
MGIVKELKMAMMRTRVSHQILMVSFALTV